MMSLPVRVAGTGETEVTIEKEANWETQGLDGTILFKWILKKYDRREQTTFKWKMIETNDGLLLTQCQTFWFNETWEIS